MRRGEVWWARLPPPAGTRPVLLLSRDEAYAVRKLATIAPVTTRIRNLPVEVGLGPEDGMDRNCVVNADTITTIPLRCLERRIAVLSPVRLVMVEEAIRFALGMQPARS